ncbi:hypothetical protein MNBD_GAMMA13-1212 [hydrothermal vent metagenome]|uniref:Helix-hairpin-helix domain-containing protein n=1 Tax=hydrothermal vent metagenome TaxID=652676 RepID=A0A3B0Z547_9ZZZZ
MSDCQFYAEPTVFDRCQMRISGWLRSHLSGLPPYGWVVGFGVLGSISLITAIAVLAVTLSSGADGDPLLWNQSIARVLVISIGLTAAQVLFRQALNAWPSYIKLPLFWHRIGRYVGWQQPARRHRPNSAARQPVEDQQAIQDFFAGVRAAGVNVAVARALFGAGIRSSHHLLTAHDGQLRSIRGIGPATVRKLRARFQE